MILKINYLLFVFKKYVVDRISSWKLMFYDFWVFNCFFDFDMDIFMILLDLILDKFFGWEIWFDVLGVVGIGNKFIFYIIEVYWKFF